MDNSTAAMGYRLVTNPITRQSPSLLARISTILPNLLLHHKD